MMFTKRFIFCCAVSFFVIGCSSTNTDHSREDLPEIVRITKVVPYHFVKEGDTVGSIAEKYDMTRAELIKLNNLTPPYQLYNGQRLVVKPKTDSLGSQSDPDIVVRENTLQSSSQTVEIEDKSKINEEDDSTVENVEEIPVSSGEGVLGKKQQDNVSSSNFAWPIDGAKRKISQKFGESSVDDGIIINSSAGTPIKSIASGTVKVAKVPDGDAAAYGLTVVIKHESENKLSVYSHLQEHCVKVGQSVKKGQIIGKVGKSGKARSPQLYLEIFDISGGSRKPVNPENLLP